VAQFHTDLPAIEPCDTTSVNAYNPIALANPCCSSVAPLANSKYFDVAVWTLDQLHANPTILCAAGNL